MRKLKNVIAGRIITVLFFLIEIAFMGLIISTRMLPTMILIIIGLFLLIFGLIVHILTYTIRKKVRFTFGLLMAIVLTAVYVLGGKYIYDTTSALSGMSGVRTEISQVGIYVRTDDPAQALIDAKDYTFGIMERLDRKNTEVALSQLEDEFGEVVAFTSYEGLTEVIDALEKEEVGAVILNQAYITVLEEMEGYEDISSRIRELTVKSVETKIVEEETKDPENIKTMFISGIDTRGKLIAKSRSDVNIIAVANTDTKQMLLVSTPRDYFVPLSISDGVPDKLTHAGIYGVDVSMDTLGMLYDMNVQKYFRVNFGGFVKIIDALGGVDVTSDYDFRTGQYHFDQGMNHLNGDAALAFSRERYAFSGGDRQRGKNQMAVIKGVAHKAMSPELLKNYSSVLESVEGCFETNMEYKEIGKLVQQQLKDGGKWNIVTYSVDGTGAHKKPYSMSMNAYVMIPNEATVDKAKELIQKVKDGEVLSQEDMITG